MFNVYIGLYHSRVKENLAPWRKLILVVLDYPWIEMSHNTMLWWKENAHRTKEMIRRLRSQIKEMPSVKLQHSMNIKINGGNKAGTISETYRTMAWVAECLLNVTKTWVWVTRVEQTRHGNMSFYSNVRERCRRIRCSRLWSLVKNTRYSCKGPRFSSQWPHQPANHNIQHTVLASMSTSTYMVHKQAGTYT